MPISFGHHYGRGVSAVMSELAARLRAGEQGVDQRPKAVSLRRLLTFMVTRMSVRTFRWVVAPECLTP